MRHLYIITQQLSVNSDKTKAIMAISHTDKVDTTG